MSTVAATLAATISVASPSIASDCAPDPTDQQVLELASRIAALKAEASAAHAEWSVADDAYNSGVPDIPDVLLWRIGDPVGYDKQVTRNGRRYLTCRLSDIEQLKGKPAVGYWEFIGTEAESKTVSQDDFDHFGAPKPHIARLYRGVENERLTKRLRQLVTAAQDYTRRCDELAHELGLGALEERVDVLHDGVWSLVEKLIELPAKSFSAIQAKAAVLNQYAEEFEDQGDQAHGLVRSLLTDLCGARIN